MSRSKKFQPSAMFELEGRVVFSHVVNLTANLNNLVRPPANVAATVSVATSPGLSLVPGAPAAPGGGNTFPLDIHDTLQAGTPVYEQEQIIDSDKAPNEFIDELIVPDLATGGRTTTEWIQNVGFVNQTGVEKVVNVKTVNGNTTTNQITTTLPDGTIQSEVETAVTSGNTTTYTDVTTLPNGTVQTNKYTDVEKGNRTLIKDGSQPAPDGRVEKYSGVKYTVGEKTYTYKTFVQPRGPVKSTESVVTSLGDSGQEETNMTHLAGSHETITNRATIVWRLNPPTS